MKKYFLIIYDLKNPNRDYNTLYDTIKELSLSYQHPLESTWFISTDRCQSAQSIFDRLQVVIDDNDSLFIVNMNDSQDCEGWMPKAFWTWYADKVNFLSHD